MKAEELLRQGDVAEALETLQQQIRSNPADPKLRVFLFQLLSVMGQWERALTQLNVSAEMDPGSLLMAQVGRQAIACELLRKEVFGGKRSPLVFGKPAEWVGWMIQANQLTAEAKHAAAAELRARAFDAAPATSGTLNGTAFEWVADADQRLGPMLEAIVDGRYFWVPFENIQRIQIEKPTDLRDVVWAPANFTWSNGGTAVGLIPTRYPGTESSGDGSLMLARRTDWPEPPGGSIAAGLGQRMLATDAGEYPLLEVREVVLNTAGDAEAPGAPTEGPGATGGGNG